MKRITVSLPDDLVDRIRAAAGGEGMVSSYVATALADYQERETLAEILESWAAETPVSDEARHVRYVWDGRRTPLPAAFGLSRADCRS